MPSESTHRPCMMSIEIIMLMLRADIVYGEVKVVDSVEAIQTLSWLLRELRRYTT